MMRKEVDDLSSSHFSSSELSDRSTPDGFVSPRQTGKIGRLNSQRRANSIHLTLNTLRFEQGVLYGRETEIETLKKSFQNQHSVVLIAGASGIGKTSLALQLQRPVKKAGGVFVSGKYDFSQRTHPFTGIKQACRMLSEHLLLSKPSDERLSHLRETLSGMIHIVAEIVPGILNVVGIDSEGDSFDEIGVRESRNRFRFALKAFLQVLVSWSPLVMLLDDLQWADAESLELLESLVNDPQLKGMTLVGCYRSNEVDDAHLLAKWVRNIEALESVDTTRINLSSLTASAVSQMIAGILSVDLPRTKGMAKVVTRKTLGNPFFVIQFLKALHERGILDYNLGLLEWTWNDDDIESKMLPTENVADLVKAKMSALAESMREVLPLAACLGSTFTECSLEIVMKAFLKNATISPPCRESEELIVARNWLDFCAKEGLIERSDPEGGRYRWVHDKIQEAAMDLVEAPDELSFLRYRMGCILLRSLDEDELNKMIFIVTNLLNEDIGSCWTTGDLPFEIAEMNLRAGKKAIAFASFEQAAVYLQRGIEWLPGDHWIERYELSLELYSSAAEALYALGGASPMEFYCNEVIRQDRPLLDKMRAYHVLIDALGNKLLLTKTIDMIVSVLSQLGCHFPKRGLLLYVLCGLLRVKITTRKLTVEKLSQLKEMDDRSKMEAMRLLDKLATFTFIAKSDLLPLAILKSFRWSLEFGICCNSPPAFATVGLILSTALGDLKGSRVYGDHALALQEKYQHKATEARTLFLANVHVLHNTKPLHLCMKPLLRGYQMGMVSGDVESAMYCMYFHLEHAFFVGRPLEGIEQDLRIYAKQMKDFEQGGAYYLAVSLQQLIANLLGRSENPRELIGEVMNVEESLNESDDVVPEHTKMHLRRTKFYLSFLFGDDERGAELVAERLEKHPNPNRGAFGLCHMEVNQGALCYGAARKTGKRKYLVIARRSHKMIKRYIQGGNPNFTHFDHLLNAEWDAYRGRSRRAFQNYNKACFAAARMGRPHEHALISERMADYAMECGDRSEAEYRLSNALGLYQEWGSLANAEQVEHKKLNNAPVKAAVMQTVEG